MRKVTLVSMLAVVLVVALAVPAQAVLVRNADTLELLFFDDFEGPAPNADADNGAYPGSWAETGGITANVDDQASSPGGQTPNEQAQMMHVNPGFNQGAVEGTLSSTLTTGKNMHAEMALMGLNGYGNYHFGVRFTDSSDANVFQFYDENGYVGSNAANFTSLIWDTTAGNWNILEVDYVLGSTSMTVTLNGLSETKNVGTFNEIAKITFRQMGNGASFLVDASIPEPATISLLALGGLMVLRRRR